MASKGTDTVAFYEDEEQLKKLCNFLRSSDGPAVREAVEMDKRVYYLKGKCVQNLLIQISWQCYRSMMCHCVTLADTGLIPYPSTFSL